MPLPPINDPDADGPYESHTPAPPEKLPLTDEEHKRNQANVPTPSRGVPWVSDTYKIKE